MSAFVRPKITGKKSALASSYIGNVTFTVGTEATDAINVAVQLKDAGLRDLTTRGFVRAWLSEDSHGDTPVRQHLMPSGGVACGTDGTMLKGPLLDEALFTKGTLVIDAVPEKFKTTTTAVYRLAGAQYTKAAATAILFTAAHTVTASKFGCVLIQVNAAGTVSTKVVSATQAYNTAALALASLPAPDASNVALGYIAIANNTGDWVANTDDLTAASDVTTATFVDAPENGKYPNQFSLVSEADGDIDVTITETGIRTYYLNVEMDGKIKTSGAITFA